MVIDEWPQSTLVKHRPDPFHSQPGPGGAWVCNPPGAKPGLLKLPELPANLAWGDADGKRSTSLQERASA